MTLTNNQIKIDAFIDQSRFFLTCLGHSQGDRGIRTHSRYIGWIFSHFPFYKAEKIATRSGDYYLNYNSAVNWITQAKLTLNIQHLKEGSITQQITEIQEIFRSRLNCNAVMGIEDLRQEIASHLSAKDLLLLGQVNKPWNTALKNLEGSNQSWSMHSWKKLLKGMETIRKLPDFQIWLESDNFQIFWNHPQPLAHLTLPERRLIILQTYHFYLNSSFHFTADEAYYFFNPKKASKVSQSFIPFFKLHKHLSEYQMCTREQERHHIDGTLKSFGSHRHFLPFIFSFYLQQPCAHSYYEADDFDTRLKNWVDQNLIQVEDLVGAVKTMIRTGDQALGLSIHTKNQPLRLLSQGVISYLLTRKETQQAKEIAKLVPDDCVPQNDKAFSQLCAVEFDLVLNQLCSNAPPQLQAIQQEMAYLPVGYHDQFIRTLIRRICMDRPKYVNSAIQLIQLLTNDEQKQKVLIDILISYNLFQDIAHPQVKSIISKIPEDVLKIRIAERLQSFNKYRSKSTFMQARRVFVEQLNAALNPNY